MASRSIGGIYASLSLKDDGFSAGMKKAADSMSAWTVAKGELMAHGIEKGLHEAYEMTVKNVEKTLEHAHALEDLSESSGMAVKDLMILQRAYKDGGREAELASKDIGKMQKAIVAAAESKPGSSNPFSKIGIDAKELLKLNPAAQFEMIGNALMRIENPAERTAEALKIFGKGAQGLAAVFPQFEGAKKSLGDMPEMMERFSGAMARADKLLSHLPQKTDQFFTGFTAGIIGTVLPGLESIDDFDFTKLGKSLGDSLAWGLELFKNGDAWQLFKDGLKVGAEEVANNAADWTIRSKAGQWATGIELMFHDMATGQDNRTDGQTYLETGADWAKNAPKVDMFKDSKDMADIVDRTAAAVERADEALAHNQEIAEKIGKTKHHLGPDPYAPDDHTQEPKPPKAAREPAPDYSADPYITHGLYLAGADQGNSKMDGYAERQAAALENQSVTQNDINELLKGISKKLLSLTSGALFWTDAGSADAVTP